MAIFVPITKVDAEQRLVYGTLSAEVADKSGEILDYATAKPAFEEWSRQFHEATGGKSLGNVRAMHSTIAAGKLTELSFDDDAKRIDGCAKIVDDSEWEKVLEGVYTGFSIGGGYARRWTDPNDAKLKRYTPVLSEVSIVDNPCVPTATFEVIKADGSREMRKFITPSNEDSMTTADKGGAAAADNTQPAADAGTEDALLKAAREAEGKGEATEEQKALLAKADGKPKLIEDGKPVKPKSAVVQKNVWLSSDGLEHPNKRAAEVHELHLEKQVELAPALGKMDALLKGAKKPEDEDEDMEGDDEETKKAKKARRDEKAAKAKEKEEAEKAAAAAELAKKDYSDKERKEMAANGEAMEGGEFPIKTKKDVEDAVHDWGRAGSKADVKAHIIARAKAIGAEDALPDDWKEDKKDKKSKKSAGGKLKKGLYQIGWLANLLSDLQCLQGNVEFEQMWEQDSSSELPGKFKALVAEMCQVLVALVDEETSELIEEGQDVDVEVMEMAAKMDAPHAAALAKHVKHEKLKAELEKSGARHSKSDKEALMELHKSACDHVDAIEKCFKGMGVMPEESGDEGAQKMSKLLDLMAAEKMEKSALLAVLEKTNSTLEKAATRIEGLEKSKSELAERVENLERQPAAGKGHVKAISKAQDNGGTGDGDTAAEFKAKLEKMTPDERSKELMKLALANPTSK